MLPDDVMFSASVRAEQERHGSREAYARRAANGGFATDLSDESIAFILTRNSAYLATASAVGQPYVQHRGRRRGLSRCSVAARLRLPNIPETASSSAAATWR